MFFYGFFVTFKNFDFSVLFCLYWKKDEPDNAFDDVKSSSIKPSKINKVIRGYLYRITRP